MRVIYFIFCLILPVTIVAQDSDQSIFSKTPVESHDSLFYELFKKYRQSETSKALSYARKSFDLAQRFHHPVLEIKSANAIGWIQQNSGAFDSAIATHTKALELAKRYKMADREMYSYNNLGIIYDKLDIYDRALDNYFKALELARKLSVTDVEISELNNIGVSYGKLKNFNEQLNYYQQARELKLKNGESGIDEAYVNIGLTYIDLEDHVKAKEVFQEIVKSKEVQPVIKVASLRGLARCYLLDGESQKCIYFAGQALDIAQKK